MKESELLSVFSTLSPEEKEHMFDFVLDQKVKLEDERLHLLKKIENLETRVDECEAFAIALNGENFGGFWEEYLDKYYKEFI